MRLYRWLSDFKSNDQPLALAIGNFDGFHVGHQAVVAKMQEKARAMNLQSAVMVFEPQPMEFFGKSVPPRLFNLRDKLRTFCGAGVDNVIRMSFTRNFAALSDEEFVEILHSTLNVRSVTVGSQFGFGKGAKYKLADLERCCAKRGIECSAISKVETDGVRVSSTLIRSLIQNGELVQAAHYIGRPYTICGRVVHGNEIGRSLGFPTANVNLNRRVCPLRGVYAVRVSCRNGVYSGMANVGVRPTVADPQNARSLLEVNIFNFDSDIYGSEVEVAFLYKIRDEQKFASLDSLVAQLKADKEQSIVLLSQDSAQISPSMRGITLECKAG